MISERGHARNTRQDVQAAKARHFDYQFGLLLHRVRFLAPLCPNASVATAERISCSLQLEAHRSTAEAKKCATKAVQAATFAPYVGFVSSRHCRTRTMHAKLNQWRDGTPPNRCEGNATVRSTRPCLDVARLRSPSTCFRGGQHHRWGCILPVSVTGQLRYLRTSETVYPRKSHTAGL